MTTHTLPASASASPTSGARTRTRSTIGAGVWRVADPKITLASVASMIVGACAAALDGPLAWGWLALTVLGIFFVEAAKNASGEIFDWDSGADAAVRPEERSPFSGGKRVIVDGLLTRRQTAYVAGAFYLAAAAIGLAIVAWREPAVMWLGMLGMGIAFSYHAPPAQLSYRGLGELAVAFSYGPLIAAGTYLVQRGDITGTVLWPAIPLGLAVGAFLWINEFPDARADATAGKRTLVVRLGRPRAAVAFTAIVGLGQLGVMLLPLVGLPLAVWLGLAGAPHAWAAARRLRRFPETPAEIIPAQAWTLLSFVLMSVGIGAGMVLASILG
jgi:1,4-dihydroxy-2-naphthoate octaprenyltransferase